MTFDDVDIAVAQLRHLYAQMVTGKVTDPKAAAQGLLGPAIKKLEKFQTSNRVVGTK